MRKSETSDLRYRVYPISAHQTAQVGNIRLATSGLPDIGASKCASRKHPTCDIGFTRYRRIKLRKSETSDLRHRVYPISAHQNAQIGNIRLAISGLPDIGASNCASRKHPTCDIGFTRYRRIKMRKSETSDLCGFPKRICANA